jgi:hypothetical protein
MNEGHDYPCAGSLIVNLRRLNFGPPQSNGREVSRRAVIPQPPDSALFALNVSTKISDGGKKAAEEDLRVLVADLEADFLLTTPRSDDVDETSGDPDPEQGYSDLDVLITPELVAATLDGEYGVVFIVQASIPGLSGGSESVSSVNTFDVPQTTIKRRTKHIYRSESGAAIKTTVTSIQNTEHVYPGNLEIDAPDDKTVKSTKVTIVNRSQQKSAVYSMTGSWKQVIVKKLAGPAAASAGPE